MEGLSAPRRTGVDDLVRGIVVLALLWMWTLTGALALLPAAFAAMALVWHRPWARIPLALSGLLVAAVGAAMFAAEDRAPEAIAVLVVPGVVIAVAAMFVRIGSREPVVAAVGIPELPWDHGAPARMQSIEDDPVLLTYLDAIAHLDQQQTRRLAAAWRAIDPRDRERAWARVRAYATRSGRQRVLNEVRSSIEDWGRAAGGSPWTWSFGTMTDVDRGNLRRAAMPALLDGAVAVLARDELDAADRDALAGPWEAATSATLADEPTGPADARG